MGSERLLNGRVFFGVKPPLGRRQKWRTSVLCDPYLCVQNCVWIDWNLEKPRPKQTYTATAIGATVSNIFYVVIEIDLLCIGPCGQWPVNGNVNWSVSTVSTSVYFWIKSVTFGYCRPRMLLKLAQSFVACTVVDQTYIGQACCYLSEPSRAAIFHFAEIITTVENMNFANRLRSLAFFCCSAVLVVIVNGHATTDDHKDKYDITVLISVLGKVIDRIATLEDRMSAMGAQKPDKSKFSHVTWVHNVRRVNRHICPNAHVRVWSNLSCAQTEKNTGSENTGHSLQ